MKNLANCTMREFVAQTAKMSDSLENWLKVTDIANIRQSVPDLPDLPEKDAPDYKKAVKERRDILRKAATANAFKVVRSALGEHPDETLEVIAYACFIPLEEIDNYKTVDILRNITEIISDEDVIDFFVSLQQLDQKIGS